MKRWMAAATALGALAWACSGDDGGTAGGDGSGGSGATAASGGSSGSAASSGSGGSGGGFDAGGGSSGMGGSGASAGDAGMDPLTKCGSNLTGTLRDFRSDHPDFECTKQNPTPFTDPFNKNCGPWDPQIVGALGSPIGPDRKPAYGGGSGTASTTGQMGFDQWFRDTPGVNLSEAFRLDLVDQGGGVYAFDTDRFFPAEGLGFDAEANNPDRGPFIDDDGVVRNYHFTYELHTTFRYEQGNVFTFRGDDDVFVYIDDKLVINLGGIHVPLLGSVNLDTGRVEITAPLGIPDINVVADRGFTESIAGGVAGTVNLNLTAGEAYDMDFFFAERNCCGSNFRVETNLVFVDCGVGPIQ